jgi:hypothetical protein
MSSTSAFWFEVAKLAVAAIALVSAYFGFKTYKANLQKQEDDRTRDADKELVGQALRSLEWAYSALTDDGATVPPKADRLNWLTCARHLLRHSKLSERIKSETYQLVHAEHEEYWRHKFYLALNHQALLSTRYFTADERNPWPENIEVSSAMVIVKFSSWPEDKKDPTDEVNRAAMAEDGAVFKGFAGRGLRAYIEALEEARKRPRAQRVGRGNFPPSPSQNRT